uniref:Uncharacterized protein n=1 Tax=Anopheles atroparvus TaxID=41427 RepID=A0A182IYQ2_ANOAO
MKKTISGGSFSVRNAEDHQSAITLMTAAGFRPEGGRASGAPKMWIVPTGAIHLAVGSAIGFIGFPGGSFSVRNAEDHQSAITLMTAAGFRPEGGRASGAPKMWIVPTGAIHLAVGSAIGFIGFPRTAYSLMAVQGITSEKSECCEAKRKERLRSERLHVWRYRRRLAHLLEALASQLLVEQRQPVANVQVLVGVLQEELQLVDHLQQRFHERLRASKLNVQAGRHRHLTRQQVLQHFWVERCIAVVGVRGALDQDFGQPPDDGFDWLEELHQQLGDEAGRRLGERLVSVQHVQLRPGDDLTEHGRNLAVLSTERAHQDTEVGRKHPQAVGHQRKLRVDQCLQLAVEVHYALSRSSSLSHSSLTESPLATLTPVSTNWFASVMVRTDSCAEYIADGRFACSRVAAVCTENTSVDLTLFWMLLLV